MRLDTTSLRHLTATDWRTLTAVETGSRNHELVPLSLITSLSKSHHGSQGDITRSISFLAKTNLIAKVPNAKYDGYRLTYGGYDYLAVHSLLKAGVVYSVGNQIGVGKESDIFVVSDAEGTQRVLKVHRLGRVSFRKNVRNKRDYARGRKQKERSAGSWMEMSRLAALREWGFMRALFQARGKAELDGVNVPEPLGWNRHCIVMGLVDGLPLRQISRIPRPAELYAELMEMVVSLAGVGLIHGDFNEFNIMIREEESEGDSREDGDGDTAEVKLVPVLIDFPQMVSVDHVNAQMYFERDVECVKRFFNKRFGFVSDESGPFFEDAKKLLRADRSKRLDVEVEASGFSKKMARELEAYMKEQGGGGVDHDRDSEGRVEEGREEGDDDDLEENDDGAPDNDDAELENIETSR